jgi:hypothetical protein
MTQAPTSKTNHHGIGVPSTRGCPVCAGAAVRTSRSWADRVLSLWMPVKRYRCAAPQCGWEGLLMPRFRRRTSKRAAASPSTDERDDGVGETRERRPALMAFRSRLP